MTENRRATDRKNEDPLLGLFRLLTFIAAAGAIAAALIGWDQVSPW